jgi:hypothetical protein
MRSIATVALVLLAATAVHAGPTREWSVEVEWGDSIPAGTVYNVKVDNTGHFKAERKGMPITPDGKLTAVVHELTLSKAECESVRAAVERIIRGADLFKAQGSMGGDGGHVYLYVWDGTVALAAQLVRLSTLSEGGTDTERLLADLSRRFPAGFVK